MVEHTLDVSDLEPPSPLTQTLEAAERLAPGDHLRMLHRRFPCLLEAQLKERGFDCEILSNEEDDSAETFIWREGDQGAEKAARARIAEC